MELIKGQYSCVVTNDIGNTQVLQTSARWADETQWQYTYYVRDASGNVMAVYEKNTFEAPPLQDITLQENISMSLETMSTITKYEEYFYLSEWDMYGSGRLGIVDEELLLEKVVFNGVVQE
ncbi:MAG: hypothetical protein M3Q97_05285, partial [Bacteroidota bacterium]|nr:hypothetical protein [Bacteroidota bacterium]